MPAFGLRAQKPRHYREMVRVAWENRDQLPFAWRILRDGVCDGCALGTSGLKDWTLPGTHLCMVRLELMRLNTAPALDVRGPFERRSVCGVGASVATEHVAGELVEHNDQRQAAPCIVAPAVEVAGCGLLVETGELVCDPGVELWVFTEPLVAELAVAGLAFAAEPEVENLLGPTRHGP